MMDIREFMETYVEGYLFEDLRVLADVPDPPSGRYGALVYPMLATTLAGVELLGNLVQPAGRKRGGPAFEFFWRTYLYPGPPRCELAESVYGLLRNGLAHVFLAKLWILPTKDGDSRRHLCFNADGSLVVDALVLSEDLRGAYNSHLKPLRLGTSAILDPGGVSLATMQARLDKMLGEHELSATHDKVLRAIAPALPRCQGPGSMVNSPTAGANYSAGAPARSPFVPVDPLKPKG